MKTASDIVEELRSGINMTDTQQSQIMYETGLKVDQWLARAEALPLIVGCAPGDWQTYLKAEDKSPQEELLWHIIANDLGIEADNKLDISSVVEWARAQSISLHPSFLRIYEFVRKVLVVGANNSRSEEGAKAVEDPAAAEREIVLGAALSLLAKMPESCLDAHGFVDGAAIVDLMNQTAARWFPHIEPTMTRTEMAALIDKWLE